MQRNSVKPLHAEKTAYTMRQRRVRDTADTEISPDSNPPIHSPSDHISPHPQFKNFE